MATLGYTPVTSNTLLNFGDNVLDRNDDGSSTAIDITAIFEDGIDIGGQTFTKLYVNNNGNITFGYGLSTYTPGVIGGTTGLEIIAPFWADVDTRVDVPGANDGVFWDIKEGRDSMVFTWNQTGYYSGHIDRLDTFQLELMDRGAGNVEIIFRYKSINWTTGDASDGSGGLGGIIARGGFSLGGLYFELPASGNQTNMLDLESNAGNLGVTGVWQFLLQDGTPSGFGTTGPDTFLGTARRDIWFGLAGDDTASGQGTGDVIYGNAGHDRLMGEAGADRLYGDTGDDRLFGGIAVDLLNGGGGDDLLNGGSGADRAEFLTSAAQDIVVRLAQGTATGQGTDTLVSIENATTGAGADALYGTAEANSLNGGAGGDRLFGNDGADRLQGARGSDTLSGGDGADRFVFVRGDGQDIVTDFQNGTDRLVIDTGAASFAAVTVTDAGDDVRVAVDGLEILIRDIAPAAIGASDFVFV